MNASTPSAGEYLYNLRAVGYQQDPPYTLLTNWCWSFDCPTPGVEVEFLQVTLQTMNSTATILPIDVDLDTSIDMISQGLADITLLSARQTLSRMEKVYFTTPVGYVYYGYLAKEVPELKVDNYIFSAFYWNALILLLVSGMVVGVFLYIYSVIFRLKQHNLINWMLICCRGILRQYYFYLNRPTCALVLIATWLFACQVIITYYEAKLKSFLMLSHHEGATFNTFEEVLDAVEDDGWTMVVQKRGYTPEMFCKDEQCQRLSRLNNSIVHISIEDDILAYLSREKHVGFAALPGDLTPSEIVYFSLTNKILFVRDAIIAPDFLAFAVSKKIPGLRERFNRAVAITTGGYGTIQARYTKPYTEYASATYQRAIVLQTSHFLILYQICGISAAVGVCFFGLELMSRELLSRWSWLGRSDTYWLLGQEWRFRRPAWEYKSSRFPRHSTIVLPVRRTHSPVKPAYTKYYTY